MHITASDPDYSLDGMIQRQDRHEATECIFIVRDAMEGIDYSKHDTHFGKRIGVMRHRNEN